MEVKKDKVSRGQGPQWGTIVCFGKNHQNKIIQMPQRTLVSIGLVHEQCRNTLMGLLLKFYNIFLKCSKLQL